MGDITENFSKKDFDCKCMCGLNNIDVRLIQRLQVIRDIVRVPIRIRSGCRCQQHNSKEGGEPESLHLKGEAVDWDFYTKEIDPFGETLLKKICTKLLDNWSGGFHYYPPKGNNPEFCHCDIGRRRRW
jgi:uncharacterized protein YcbK (DUF882 family)